MSPRRHKTNKRPQPSRAHRQDGNAAGELGKVSKHTPDGSAGGKKSALAFVTGRRLWLLRAAAVVLAPVLFLLLLETGLRVGGYGFRPTVTVPCTVNGVACRGDNVKFGWRFFPRNIAQEFDPFVFPAVKPPGTYRIFVLGESAAQGTPDPAYSFGRILEAMLDHAHPETDFEVIVAAMPAINSHVAVEIARDVAKYEPDLFVLYLGNNEIVGPYGPGTVFSPLSPSLALIRAGIRLKATRTGQLLANLASRMGAEAQTPKVWRGLEMFESRRVAADDPRLETTYKHFRQNLDDIRRVAVHSGAEVIFCTLGCNLRDCPPFASMPRAGLGEGDVARWTGLYENAAQREAEGDYVAALESYLAAEKIDDRFADLQFRLGECYWLTGDYDQARDRFALARELDALRLRPDRRINEMIRAAATATQDQRIHLVDVDEAFRAGSPSGVPGRELFHEHVHLTFHGNYLLARILGEQVERILAANGESQPAGSSFPEEAGCAQRLGYNAWAHYNTLFKVLNYYVKKPPFVNQLYHAELVRRLENELKEAESSLTVEVRKQVAAQYRSLIEKSPDDIWHRLRFAEFASVWRNDERTAVEQCRRVQGLMPHSYKPHLLMALSLGRLNRFEEAVEHLRKVVQIKPTCGQAYHLLGLACQAQGQVQEALAGFAKAIELRPDDWQAYQRTAELLLTRGQVPQAERILRQGLSNVPDDPRLHNCLAGVLRRQGRKVEADLEARAASRPGPDSLQDVGPGLD